MIPLVLTADMDRAVSTVTKLATSITAAPSTATHARACAHHCYHTDTTTVHSSARSARHKLVWKKLALWTVFNSREKSPLLPFCTLQASQKTQQNKEFLQVGHYSKIKIEIILCTSWCEILSVTSEAGSGTNLKSLEFRMFVTGLHPKELNLFLWISIGRYFVQGLWVAAADPEGGGQRGRLKIIQKQIFIKR